MCYLQQPADICYFVYFVVNVHVLLLKLLGNRPKASIAFSYSNTPMYRSRVRVRNGTCAKWNFLQIYRISNIEYFKQYTFFFFVWDNT